MAARANLTTLARLTYFVETRVSDIPDRRSQMRD
jgi:hypothetical protein